MSTTHSNGSEAHDDEGLWLCFDHRTALHPYLPTEREKEGTPSQEVTKNNNKLPYVTVTYASSLDSAIASLPGTQTKLSGAESKAMTHYLRTKYDGILVGAGTAISDNPRLISRSKGDHNQPRPIVLDPSGRWLERYDGTDNLTLLARSGLGFPPWVIVNESVVTTSTNVKSLCDLGGLVLSISKYRNKQEGVDWSTILSQLAELGIGSLMVEGGSSVINDLLRKRNKPLISSVIVTIAPVYIGVGGVMVSPQRDDDDTDPSPLKDVIWLPMGRDVVMAGLIK